MVQLPMTHIVLNNPDRAAQVASPGDSILAKLEWLKMCGEITHRHM